VVSRTYFLNLNFELPISSAEIYEIESPSLLSTKPMVYEDVYMEQLATAWLKS